MQKILLIDDEAGIRESLGISLQLEGFRTVLAENGKEGLDKAKDDDDFDFIICDMKMPEMDGLTFLKEYRKHNSNTVVIMISAYGDIDSSINAVQQGADDYISKPVKVEELVLRMKMAEEKFKLRKDNQKLKKVLSKDDKFENIVSVSRAMEEVKELASKSAQYNTTVLIRGESGTGKELIANSIHNNSNRKDGPFIAINCAAIPETLLESELFGYEKGAFSGATSSKKGLFEIANNGTLLLDEIADFPMQLQTKLLRFLQEGEIRRLGNTKTEKYDVRVLTATNTDLETHVSENKFRSDLYYRINVLQIYIPPLRERKEDIPHLINYFIEIFNLKFDKNVKGFGHEALNNMIEYPWYGNVRELENTIERSVILADTDIIEDVELNKFNDKSSLDLDFWFENYTMDNAKQKVEKAYIERALNKTNGNRTKAAELLNISRRNLLYKLKEFEINN